MRSELKQKIILLLASGVALGLTRSPRNYFKILKGVAAEWKEIEKRRLHTRLLKSSIKTDWLTLRKKKTVLLKLSLLKPGIKKLFLLK